MYCVIRQFYINEIRSLNISIPFQIVDLMMFEKLDNTFYMVSDHLLLSRHETLHIRVDFFSDVYPELLSSMKLFKNLSRCLHDLGWNTPPVKTGPPDVIMLDECDLGSKLSSAYGSNITARTRAYDGNF